MLFRVSPFIQFLENILTHLYLISFCTLLLEYVQIKVIWALFFFQFYYGFCTIVYYMLWMEVKTKTNHINISLFSSFHNHLASCYRYYERKIWPIILVGRPENLLIWRISTKVVADTARLFPISILHGGWVRRQRSSNGYVCERSLWW